MRDLATARELVAVLRERGVQLTLAGERQLRAKPWRALGPELRHDIQRNRDEIIAVLKAEQAPAPPVNTPPPPPEPEPVVFAYGHRITERDVHAALRALGDDALADYDAGRITKAEVYEIARLRECQFRQLCS